MAKQLKLEYEGKTYTLEYTRKSIATMERTGFVAKEVLDKPMSMLPALFAGAFIAHHKYIKEAVVDEIYENIPNKADLIGKLTEMYNEPLEAMMEEPEEGDEGKVEWTANW